MATLRAAPLLSSVSRARADLAQALLLRPSTIFAPPPFEARIHHLQQDMLDRPNLMRVPCHLEPVMRVASLDPASAGWTPRDRNSMLAS